MSAQATWNLAVSQEVDEALRQFLADQVEAREGALSRFVEKAVQARILELEAERAIAENADKPATLIEHAIDEALEWARRA